jgi:hypothetical protein
MTGSRRYSRTWLMQKQSVLISGIGIAGPTLAFWLKSAGFEPTLIERAPALRTGGYVIDFWGLGYDIAERMGLARDINRTGYHVREMRIVDDRGKRATGFGTKVFDELTGGRYMTLGRSDLSRLLFEKVKATTEVIFDDEIVDLQDQAEFVQVQFKHASERQFDLVIGADGLHSDIRRLAFGPQYQFEKQLGYVVAAFEVRGYRPRDENVYVMYGQPADEMGPVLTQPSDKGICDPRTGKVCRGQRYHRRLGTSQLPMAIALPVDVVVWPTSSFIQEGLGADEGAEVRPGGVVRHVFCFGTRSRNCGRGVSSAAVRGI